MRVGLVGSSLPPSSPPSRHAFFSPWALRSQVSDSSCLVAPLSPCLRFPVSPCPPLSLSPCLRVSCKLPAASCPLFSVSPVPDPSTLGPFDQTAARRLPRPPFSRQTLRTVAGFVIKRPAPDPQPQLLSRPVWRRPWKARTGRRDVHTQRRFSSPRVGVCFCRDESLSVLAVVYRRVEGGPVRFPWVRPAASCFLFPGCRLSPLGGEPWTKPAPIHTRGSAFVVSGWMLSRNKPLNIESRSWSNDGKR